jgi:coiled-coil domain-containing protein 61
MLFCTSIIELSKTTAAAAAASSKQNSNNSAINSATARVNTKRYLILTYAVEFDRVHYPLPLTHQDSASPEALQRTIQRLRKDLTAGVYLLKLSTF